MRGEPVILDAAIAELEDVGFAMLSFEGVAARARASQAAVEHRWKDRLTLVGEAMSRYRSERATGCADTGSVRGDLVAQCSLAVGLLRRLGPRLVVSLSEAWHEHPRLCDVLEDTMGPTEDRLPPGVLLRGVARGELPPGELPPVFQEVAMPVLITRVVTGASVEKAFLEHLVEDVVLPVLLSAPGRAPDG